MCTEMLTEQQVQHVGSVDALRKRHLELKAEIDTRDDVFSSVVNTGNAMVEAKHDSMNEVRRLFSQSKRLSRSEKTLKSVENIKHV